MTAEQACRHAPGARQADLALARLDEVGGFAIIRIGEPPPHPVTERSLLQLCPAREIGAGRLVQHRRKTIRLYLIERVGKAVDRIVLARLRGMAAAVANRQGIAREGLLGGLHRRSGGRTVGIHRNPPAVGV